MVIPPNQFTLRRKTTSGEEQRLDEKDAASCHRLLQQCEMFHKVPPDLLSEVVKKMTVKRYQRNERFIRQGDPCDRFHLLEEGEIERKFYDEETGKKHVVQFPVQASSINSMRILSSDPYHNSIKCISESCKLYQMKRDVLLPLLKAKPDIALYMAEGLSEALRKGSKKYQTPFLQLQQQDINVTAVAIAAGIESYYRSALNALLNARLTGVKADLFPNMHIQVPVRITYIAGFKVLRSSLDTHVDPEAYAFPNLVRWAMVLSPGIVMTPVSSILEASNAGHMNPESMTRRWIRGGIPRCGREIIFGLGLNQMSEYFEERLTPFFPPNSAVLANAAGSVTAGIVSGYLSHVPHNLSTYKLLEPHKSYWELYSIFVKKSVPPAIDVICESWPGWARTAVRTTAATLFPRGLLIRTTQIVGSFMILNGTINYLHLMEMKKIHAAAMRQ